MHFLNRSWDSLRSSFRRLYARKLTGVAAVFGLCLSLSLIISISRYADEIYYQTFLENVAETRENPENKISFSQPTFAFLFHYFGGWHGSKSWDELKPLDDYITQEGINQLKIPSVDLVRLFETDTFYLFPQEGENNNINSLYLTRTSFGAMSGIEKHITLNGGYSNGNTLQNDSPIEILVNENLAQKAGLQLDQTFLAYFKRATQNGSQETVHIPVRIVGIWKANNVSEDYWIFGPSYYENIILVKEDVFFTRLAAENPVLVHNAYWYLIMDSNYVHADEVNGLVNRINRTERGSNELLPNLWLSISPKEALQKYSKDAQVLRIMLYAFAIPVIGLTIAFINLVSRLSTEQARHEIAIIRSRGGTVSQVLSFTFLDGLFLGLISLGLSLPISSWVTQRIGMTRGFSDFTGTSLQRNDFSQGSLVIGLYGVLIFICMLILSNFKIAKPTIITQRSELGRDMAPPWWQRFWVDFLLFIPAAYGAYLLQKQGSLALIGTDGLSSDPFRNPLLFLVPSLGILSVSLFSLRIIKPLMKFLEIIVNKTRRVGLVIALRNIARQSAKYHTPLLILILTMSLYTYTVSLAETFDQHLVAQEYYRLGSDIHFFDPGDSTQSENNIRWDFFPVDEYTKLPGVSSAARLGRYSAQIETARIQVKGIYIGIDRLKFPKTAYWRDDFSDQSLGNLMNKLAENPSHVLVNAAFLEENGLRIGDSIRGTIKTYNQQTQVTFKIAGSVDYFPTWYPEHGPLLVGNLDYLFENTFGTFPYFAILKTETGIDPMSVEKEQLRGLDQRIRPVDWETPTQNINKIQSSPERQGLIGFLYIGFITTVLLTMVAFILHLVFSYQQRTVELGILRAGGLSNIQMISLLFWEFTFLLLLGGSIGTALGLFTSKVFIPYMQIGDGQTATIPPFQVLIPWDSISQIYWLFGGLFILSLILSMLLLRRIKIFEVIKLGETF